MKLNEYQDRAMKTCTSNSANFSYMMLNLVGEVGELASKIAKHIRKGNVDIDESELKPYFLTDEEMTDIKHELGDIAWQLAGLCNVMGYTLEDVCVANLDKLASRQKRGVIVGDGDNR